MKKLLILMIAVLAIGINVEPVKAITISTDVDQTVMVAGISDDATLLADATPITSVSTDALVQSKELSPTDTIGVGDLVKHGANAWKNKPPKDSPIEVWIAWITGVLVLIGVGVRSYFIKKKPKK